MRSWPGAWLKAYQSLIDGPTLISYLPAEEVTHMLTDELHLGGDHVPLWYWRLVGTDQGLCQYPA